MFFKIRFLNTYCIIGIVIFEAFCIYLKYFLQYTYRMLINCNLQNLLRQMLESISAQEDPAQVDMSFSQEEKFSSSCFISAAGNIFQLIRVFY